MRVAPAIVGLRLRPYSHRHRGMSLIEVLIAVLLMAIGMLGVAALQATALRNSQSSLERSQAVMHGYAILDAMRANLAAARAGGYDMAMTCEASPRHPADAGAKETLASNDRRDWLSAIQADLGDGGCGQIACTVVAESKARDCTVTVRWDDSRGTAGEHAHSVTAVGRL
ncbi:type IV pilus modification protein PilV [Lysobacter sp. TAF61]|uniref:type IV pilus modification protein PilV n=1 Tax=Lysobacter sp. TAF61 TaxID=3233072 RepID=UPI003F9A0F05